MSKEPWLLALNTGSSSVKFAVFGLSTRARQVRGVLNGLPGLARLSVDPEINTTSALSAMDIEQAVEFVLELVASRFGMAGLRAVGHRIVHGGSDFVTPTTLTPDQEARLQRLSTLAPLHQSFGLRGVAQARRLAPHALQIGCFDTAFHSGRPELDRLLPLPRALAARGVIRYGFHGLSYEHVAYELGRFGEERGGRAVVAHLGSGASLCALRRGRSVATTMGFTPLGGIPMTTRSGDLDPGVILYLLQAERMSADEVGDLLQTRSGLLGLSGESADLNILLASSTRAAAQAVEFYVDQVARAIVGMATVLGGLDTLVFTGGVGQNLPDVRARICSRLRWVGVALDEEANRRQRLELQADGSAIRILRICADEEAVITRQVLAALAGKPDWCG